MTYERDPDLPWYVRDGNHPATKASGLLFALFIMPCLVVIAWMKAPGFDPYSMSFFTKTYVEPSPEMPGELRIAGLVFIGIGSLLLLAGINGLAKARVRLREIWMVLWIGFCIVLFGSAFFVAADSAKDRIEQEQSL